MGRKEAQKDAKIRTQNMNTTMQIKSYFPEAFRLLANPRFVAMDGGFLDQLSGESYPLQGLEMDADSWMVVGWLLNWLGLSHSRPGVALRVPLIVIEGPLESGKSWLFAR
jgi:hypothetical protein